ncbi:MAG: hypothetical protein K0Q87_494 [Neobacillus sp.]|jgi:hypothetical protein|nr:hypothetical protein [Neobacillus sp.]
MSAKKWLTIITAFCTLLGLVLAIVFDCGGISLGYDIALATFGSALLGFIMSLTEYFSERRKAMECFWKEARITLSELRKAKPIVIAEPEELLLSCFAEECNNKKVKQYGERIAASLGLTIKHEAMDAYIKWIETNEVMNFREDDDITKILDELYESRIKAARIHFESIIKSYIELSHISIFELDNAYGNLNFLFANKRIRLNAYNDIFDKMRKIKVDICNETFHFNLWKEGKGNFVVCAKKTIEVSDMLFETKKSKTGGLEHESIYQTLFDDIDDALEDFRIKTYWSNKKEQVERIPVMGRVISFDDESSK